MLIAGTTQPFAYDRFTDITLKFENISLPVFNPYSGKFAGYNIAKGKLFTDLHYQIDNRKLEAQHKIRIDQLEWGEATASKEEATLPVKFATSLLKDADGVINARHPGERHARRPDAAHRPDRLAGHQEHPGQGRDRAVQGARRAVQGRRGRAVRRLRARLGCARSGRRRAAGRAGQEPGAQAGPAARGADRQPMPRSTARRWRRRVTSASWQTAMRSDAAGQEARRRDGAGARVRHAAAGTTGEEC